MTTKQAKEILTIMALIIALGAVNLYVQAAAAIVLAIVIFCFGFED